MKKTLKYIGLLVVSLIIAGLGEQWADKVTVRYINGQTIERTGPFRNQVISFELQ